MIIFRGVKSPSSNFAKRAVHVECLLLHNQIMTTPLIDIGVIKYLYNGIFSRSTSFSRVL